MGRVASIPHILPWCYDELRRHILPPCLWGRGGRQRPPDTTLAVRVAQIWPTPLPTQPVRLGWTRRARIDRQGAPLAGRVAWGKSQSLVGWRAARRSTPKRNSAPGSSCCQGRDELHEHARPKPRLGKGTLRWLNVLEIISLLRPQARDGHTISTRMTAVRRYRDARAALFTGYLL